MARIIYALALIIFFPVLAFAQEIELYPDQLEGSKKLLFRMHSLSVTLPASGEGVCEEQGYLSIPLTLQFPDNPGTSVLDPRFAEIIGREVTKEFSVICNKPMERKSIKYNIEIVFPNSPSLVGQIFHSQEPNKPSRWNRKPPLEDADTRTSRVMSLFFDENQGDLNPRFFIGDLLHEDDAIFLSINEVNQDTRESLLFSKYLYGEKCRFSRDAMVFAAQNGSNLAQYAIGACYLQTHTANGQATYSYGNNITTGFFDLIALVSAHMSGVHRATIDLRGGSLQGKIDKYPGIGYLMIKRNVIYKRNRPIDIDRLMSTPGFFENFRDSLLEDFEDDFRDNLEQGLKAQIMSQLKSYCDKGNRSGRLGTRWVNGVCGVTVDGAVLSFYDLGFFEMNCAADLSSCDYRYRIVCVTSNLGGKRYCSDQDVQRGTYKLR